MPPEDNPAEDRAQLEQCIEEIKRLRTALRKICIGAPAICPTQSECDDAFQWGVLTARYEMSQIAHAALM